ncbi:Polyphosphate kinase [Halomicronema hongdechloris C2206]|uniref:Polyphosphate kinase n=1 Tax=Halomicronema hongdechloris C2206 TaxID=1641165 RepID=A0A1Z3HGI0_9CYAN|nr:polyphosphate kinase 1 [Halomicronema hongdechloris]ASC69355.1 Polyphosphate kinase [Halomicronema hongdechloris C2206]
MTTAERSVAPSDLRDPQYYLSRELSWLEFNRRVLHEALDGRTPLLERLKFMAIFSSNLDEYFMVRVAGLKQQVEAQVSKRTPDGRTPSEQLRDISQTLRPMVLEQHTHFQQVLRLEMADHGISLVDYSALSDEQQAYLEKYFEEQIFPVLTPLAVDPGHPFPYISNLSLNLAVVVRNAHTGRERFARVKVPKVLPRFVSLPPSLKQDQDKASGEWMGVPLEQVIAHNLEFLFPGMIVEDHHTFRITRNADLEVEEDEADDLMLAIEKELRKRRLGGSVVRMEIEANTPEPVRTTLMQEMGLTEHDVYDIDGLVGLGDLMTFMGLPLEDLKDPTWSPVVPSTFKAIPSSSDEDDINLDLEDGTDIFRLLRQQDRLVHHPYHSFAGTVQQFITQAAQDPKVLAIKMTLYRTSGDSPIISALISAAENGKQVAVLVELKARFDEENNINWARKLEKSGVHVVYGLVGLKTHTKVALAVRREGDHIRRYVHIGTGNYNPKTARLYTDLGLLSCRANLGADLTDLFNYLTGYSQQQSYRKLLVAPVNLRQQLTTLIHREIERCQAGEAGRLIAKMNSLVDPEIIATLYEASQAGVEIDLIVRGICCLRPGMEGISDNIRVISIVGRLLEHSRIFYFHNSGDETFLIGSADWMPRNLDRRVEAVVPVEDPQLRQELMTILEVSLADNRQAWDLQADGSYRQRHPGDEAVRSSQAIFMDMALQSAE